MLIVTQSLRFFDETFFEYYWLLSEKKFGRSTTKDVSDSMPGNFMYRMHWVDFQPKRDCKEKNTNSSW